MIKLALNIFSLVFKSSEITLVEFSAIELFEICIDVWFFRDYLSTLATLSVPTNIISASYCDSMTLNIGAWLALPSTPFIVSFTILFYCCASHLFILFCNLKGKN